MGRLFVRQNGARLVAVEALCSKPVQAGVLSPTLRSGGWEAADRFLVTHLPLCHHCVTSKWPPLCWMACPVGWKATVFPFGPLDQRPANRCLPMCRSALARCKCLRYFLRLHEQQLPLSGGGRGRGFEPEDLGAWVSWGDPASLKTSSWQLIANIMLLG